PTIRGSEQGSKKRYVGTVVDQHGASQLIFKGMEAVRSDWTPFARHWQQQLYQAWFSEVPITSLVRTLIQEIQAGQWDEQLVYRKRLRQPLADYHANAPHVRAALKANQVAREHQQPLPYAKGSVVRYVITLNGPQVYGEDKLALDYQHYIEKQLKPIVEPILAMSQLSFDNIYSSQLGLF
ncbi:MAG: DNA polymerase domain-containing protein, partial [Ferrimonas sp.]